MHKAQEQVRELCRAFGHPSSPATPMLRTPTLRSSLILEEALETVNALIGTEAMKLLAERLIAEVAKKSDEGKITKAPNIVEAIDGCIDTLVVTYGALEDIGVDAEPFFEEVHRANMAKLDGPVREDGKKMKPPGWTPPDIAGVLYEMERSWKK